MYHPPRDFHIARDRITKIDEQMRALKEERSSLNEVLRRYAISAPRKTPPAPSDGRYRVLIEQHARTGDTLITSTKFAPEHALEKFKQPIDRTRSVQLLMRGEEAARALSSFLHSRFREERLENGWTGLWYPRDVLAQAVAYAYFACDVIGIDQVSSSPIGDHGVRIPDVDLLMTPDWQERNEKAFGIFVEVMI